MVVVCLSTFGILWTCLNKHPTSTQSFPLPFLDSFLCSHYSSYPSFAISLFVKLDSHEACEKRRGWNWAAEMEKFLFDAISTSSFFTNFEWAMMTLHGDCYCGTTQLNMQARAFFGVSAANVGWVFQSSRVLRKQWLIFKCALGIANSRSFPFAFPFLVPSIFFAMSIRKMARHVIFIEVDYLFLLARWLIFVFIM